MREINREKISTTMNTTGDRKTTQFPMPSTSILTQPGHYNPYPAYPLGPGLIDVGFYALAEKLAGEATVVIDGYPGVLWEHFRARLDEALAGRGRHAHWQSIDDALYP